jgi:hypothetical protein
MATAAESPQDRAAIQASATASLKTPQEKLRTDARSVLRALQAWGSIHDHADWDKAVEDASHPAHRIQPAA